MAQNNKLFFFCLFILVSSAVLNAQSEKCGTFINPINLLHLKTNTIKSKIASRESMQKNVLTQSGLFRIHYDSTGTREPAMISASGVRIPNSQQQYIDTLKKILDYVWKSEIETFGFSSPPADNNNGGGNEYDIYVVDYGSSGFYGETFFDEIISGGNSNPLYSTYIQIDNDYAGRYDTKGINGLKATCAHEFHHAIQLGGAGFWDGERYFYELCAQSLEQMVFPEVKDYIIQLRKYYENISTINLFESIQYPGYERCVWGIFLVDKYGPGIMKSIWDEMKTYRPAKASQNALNYFGTTIEREFADFSFWNFYTGYRADTAKYFKDAGFFPVVSLKNNIFISGATQDYSFTTKSFTANYIKASTSTDSAFVIISNTNYSDALTNSQQTFPFHISFSTSSATGFPAVSNSIFAKFQVEDYSNWSYTAIGSTRGPICFPNPFNPKTSSLLFSLQGLQNSNNITLNIYSASSLDLVYTGSPILRMFSGIQYAEWGGKDKNGRLASSGVYMFVLTNGTVFNKGKFAIIR